VRATRARWIARERELDTERGLAVDGGRELREDHGLPHPLLIAPAGGRVVELQHDARGLVRHHQPAMVVHDHDAFGHAGKDRAEMPAVVRQLVHALAKLLHGAIQRAGDLAQLVLAVACKRLREIAGGVPPGDLGNRRHAAGHRRRHRP
jgi:hypothetical protein